MIVIHNKNNDGCYVKHEVKELMQKMYTAKICVQSSYFVCLHFCDVYAVLGSGICLTKK